MNVVIYNRIYFRQWSEGRLLLHLIPVTYFSRLECKRAVAYKFNIKEVLSSQKI